MKKIYSIFIINFIILLLLILLYFNIFNKILLFIIIFILNFFSIIIIYNKSNTFDEKERKQKLILHKIKNSLSIIIGFNEAFKDNIINRNEFEKNMDKEISKIIKIIKDEMYKK